MMTNTNGDDIDTEDNYILSCERPASAKKYSNIETTVRMKLIPPLQSPGVLSFHYFCGNFTIYMYFSVILDCCKRWRR